VESQFPRRSLLQLGLAAPLLVLAACSDATSAPAHTSPASPVLTPSPAPTRVATPRPKKVSSFGPNGTHYPADQLWPGETAPIEIEIACTRVALTRVINNLTAAQVAQGVILRVEPGVLVGAGAGSRDKPVLNRVGDPAWEQNVIIVPRDGYGTVFVQRTGFRIENCHRLTFFGIDGADVEFYATNCTNLTVAWSVWAGLNFTQGGADISMYEVVLGFRRSPHDTFAVRPVEQKEMLTLRRYGCVFGPSVKSLGDASHSDTLQLERTGFGAFGPFTSVDCVDFGSSNSVELLHSSLSRAEFEHCMILGEQLPWKVFPLEPTDQQGNPNAFAGSAQDVRLRDSIVCGPIGRLGFTHVTNTKLSYAPVASQQPSVEGSWTVDPSIASWSADDITKAAGTEFTREALTSHWSW
jgi:hypothetical protein